MIKNKLILIFIFIICQFHVQSLSSESLTILLKKVNNTYKIDQEAALLIDELGGGIYDKEIGAIIPLQPKLIHKEWQKRRFLIAKRIGTIEPNASSQGNALWQNSAISIDELLRDAQQLGPDFRKSAEKIAKKTHSEANFGPGNAYMIKSQKSLSRKIKQDAEELGISERQALSKIGDALRGTIITNSVDNIRWIVKEIKAYVAESGGKVVFRNYWKEERQSGYVGIHAKLILPLEKCSNGQERFILAELQIHLSCIMDGSKESVKEREHLLYEKGKTHHFNPTLLSSASKLLYLTALKKNYLLTKEN